MLFESGYSPSGVLTGCRRSPRWTSSPQLCCRVSGRGPPELRAKTETPVSCPSPIHNPKSENIKTRQKLVEGSGSGAICGVHPAHVSHFRRSLVPNKALNRNLFKGAFYRFTSKWSVAFCFFLVKIRPVYRAWKKRKKDADSQRIPN